MSHPAQFGPRFSAPRPLQLQPPRGPPAILNSRRPHPQTHSQILPALNNTPAPSPSTFPLWTSQAPRTRVSFPLWGPREIREGCPWKRHLFPLARRIHAAIQVKQVAGLSSQFPRGQVAAAFPWRFSHTLSRLSSSTHFLIILCSLQSRPARTRSPISSSSWFGGCWIYNLHCCRCRRVPIRPHYHHQLRTL